MFQTGELQDLLKSKGVAVTQALIDTSGFQARAGACADRFQFRPPPPPLLFPTGKGRLGLRMEVGCPLHAASIAAENASDPRVNNCNKRRRLTMRLPIMHLLKSDGRLCMWVLRSAAAT